MRVVGVAGNVAIVSVYGSKPTIFLQFVFSLSIPPSISLSFIHTQQIRHQNSTLNLEAVAYHLRLLTIGHQIEGHYNTGCHYKHLAKL